MSESPYYGTGKVATVTLDSGVRLRRNAMDTSDVVEANDTFGRRTSFAEWVDIRCEGGGATRPAFMTIKEERYR